MGILGRVILSEIPNAVSGQASVHSKSWHGDLDDPMIAQVFLLEYQTENCSLNKRIS